MLGQLLLSTGVFLILVGFILAFVIFILLLLKSFKDEGKVKGGGAIIIGPFPIVFGTDWKSVKMVLLLSHSFSYSRSNCYDVLFTTLLGEGRQPLCNIGYARCVANVQLNMFARNVSE